MDEALPRVALVGPVPPPSGGMANQTRQLAELLRAEGMVVELVPVNRPYRPRWIAPVRGVRALFRLLPYLAQLWRTAGRVDLFHVMANSGWSWHLFAAPAIWMAKLRGRAVVLNYRGGEAEAFFARSFAWVRLSLDRVDAIVVPSGFLAEVFARRGYGTKLVPNVVDLTRFTPAASGPDTPHILVARNLEPLYDNATALRAFALVRERYPAARLTLAGTGPERDRLAALARELGVHEAVRFAGRVDNQDMPALYRSATLALNPSRADNMPISILEAWASGIPLVTTNVGGIPYLAEADKTALFVPPGDPVAMAQACLRLIAEPKLAGRLSAAGLARVRDFAWDQVRPRLLQVYRSVLRQSPVQGRRVAP